MYEVKHCTLVVVDCSSFDRKVKIHLNQHRNLSWNVTRVLWHCFLMLGYIMVTLLDHNSWIDTISWWFIISLCQEFVNVHRRIPYRNPSWIHQHKQMSLWRWGFFCNPFSEGISTISEKHQEYQYRYQEWRLKDKILQKIGMKTCTRTL